MEYHNEQERYIAILEASLPYVAPQSRHAIQLLLQSHSLIHLVKEQPDYALEAMQVGAKSDTSSDPQELLLHIQEFLTPKESDFVKTILNFYKCKSSFSKLPEVCERTYAVRSAFGSVRCINVCCVKPVTDPFRSDQQLRCFWQCLFRQAIRNR